jgi:hypothetical protein
LTTLDWARKACQGELLWFIWHKKFYIQTSKHYAMAAIRVQTFSTIVLAKTSSFQALIYQHSLLTLSMIYVILGRAQ